MSHRFLLPSLTHIFPSHSLSFFHLSIFTLSLNNSLCFLLFFLCVIRTTLLQVDIQELDLRGDHVTIINRSTQVHFAFFSFVWFFFSCPVRAFSLFCCRESLVTFFLLISPVSTTLSCFLTFFLSISQSVLLLGCWYIRVVPEECCWLSAVYFPWQHYPLIRWHYHCLVRYVSREKRGRRRTRDKHKKNGDDGEDTVTGKGSKTRREMTMTTSFFSLFFKARTLTRRTTHQTLSTGQTSTFGTIMEVTFVTVPLLNAIVIVPLTFSLLFLRSPPLLLLPSLLSQTLLLCMTKRETLWPGNNPTQLRSSVTSVLTLPTKTKKSERSERVCDSERGECESMKVKGVCEFE